jgi:hypothetical protein
MIRAVLNSVQVKARLVAMSENSRRRAYNVSMRRAAAPVVRDLQRAWGNGRRNSGIVTGEIGDGQQAKLTIRGRGKAAGIAVLQIGANYRLGGLVRLWHILEHGARHYGKSAAYQTMGAEANRLKRQRRLFFSEQTKAAGGLPKGKDARKAFYRGVRAAWTARRPEADAIVAKADRARTARRDSARASGGGRRMPGFKISTRVVSRHINDLARRAQAYLVAEVMRPVKGARRAA